MKTVFVNIGGLVLMLMLWAGVLSSAGADPRVNYSSGRSNGYSNGQPYSNHAHHHHRLHWRWHPHRLWHHSH